MERHTQAHALHCNHEISICSLSFSSPSHMQVFVMGSKPVVIVFLCFQIQLLELLAVYLTIVVLVEHSEDFLQLLLVTSFVAAKRSEFLKVQSQIAVSICSFKKLILEFAKLFSVKFFIAVDV